MSRRGQSRAVRRLAPLTVLLVACADHGSLRLGTDAAPDVAVTVDAAADVRPALTPDDEDCATAAARRGPRGCLFYATQTLHSVLARLVPGARREEFPFGIVLANGGSRAVTVTLSGGPFADPITREVPSLGATTVEVPWIAALADGVDHLHRRSALARRGAVIVRSTAPVTAYQFSPVRVRLGDDLCRNRLPDSCYAFSADASLLLPAHALGTEHVAVTLPTQRVLAQGRTEWSSSPGFVTVVGTRAGTSVELRPHGRITAGEGVSAANDGVVRLTLDEGDAVQLLSAHDGRCVSERYDRVNDSTFCVPRADEDLTGTTVTATHPVAVFVGHDCASAPFDRFACDHLEEQLPPVSVLGTSYVIPRVPPALPARPADPPEGEPMIVRVVGARDGTTLRFDPPEAHPATALDRGEVLEFETRDDVSLDASAAVLVATLRVGAEYYATALGLSGGALGDPSLSIETPVQQYRTRYELFAPQGFPRTMISVVASGAPPLLDGLPVAGEPRTRGARQVWSVRVSDGFHRVEAATPTGRVGVRLLGDAPFSSYMVPGGGDLLAITAPL